jgi:nucleotide-binding universal stress UspA family protein
MRALIAYDASAGSEQAVSLVLAMPWPTGSEVRAVAVVEPSASWVPAMPVMSPRLVPSPEIESRIVDHLETEVARIVRQLKAAHLDATGVVLRGRPATVLIDEAQRVGADLIVAGSRGHGPIASLVLGSISGELVDTAPCPVLVARSSSAKRVLLASDGSPSARQAEDMLAGWPIFDDATIRVLSVAEVVRPWHTGVAPTMYPTVIEAHRKELESAKSEFESVASAAAARLRAANRTVDSNLRVGDAAAEIVEEASSWGADVVVLGSRGLTGLSRIVLGSVARNVLQASQTSVLVVRSSAEAGSEKEG